MVDAALRSRRCGRRRREGCSSRRGHAGESGRASDRRLGGRHGQRRREDRGARRGPGARGAGARGTGTRGARARHARQARPLEPSHGRADTAAGGERAPATQAPARARQSVPRDRSHQARLRTADRRRLAAHLHPLRHLAHRRPELGRRQPAAHRVGQSAGPLRQPAALGHGTAGHRVPQPRSRRPVHELHLRARRQRPLRRGAQRQHPVAVLRGRFRRDLSTPRSRGLRAQGPRLLDRAPAAALPGRDAHQRLDRRTRHHAQHLAAGQRVELPADVLRRLRQHRSRQRRGRVRPPGRRPHIDRPAPHDDRRRRRLRRRRPAHGRSPGARGQRRAALGQDEHLLPGPGLVGRRPGDDLRHGRRRALSARSPGRPPTVTISSTSTPSGRSTSTRRRPPDRRREARWAGPGSRSPPSASGSFGAPLSSRAREVAGGAVGYQKFLGAENRRQLLAELGLRVGTANGVADAAAVSLRYQAAAGRRFVWVLDGFGGTRRVLAAGAGDDTLWGGRMELRLKF